MTTNFFSRNRYTILYGVSMAVLLFLLRWLELRLLIFYHAFEIYIAVIALFFTGLGIWLALKLSRPKIKTVVVEKPVYVTADTFVVNENELRRLGLSKREREVLELMAAGLSNNEIAARLSVSLSTIKSHAASLFVKMDVERRTQAIDLAKKLKIIP